MVLLTSSAVSGIIFAAVVCLSTFLLFLSGYALQQQTVRSLQESLRRPPERKPVPTIPAAFLNPQVEDTIVDAPGVLQETSAGGFDSQQNPIYVGPVPTFNTPDDEVKHSGSITQKDAELAPETAQSQRLANEEEAGTSLAYILTVPEPLDICSVLLFAKQQRQQSGLETKPEIRILYPTVWEASAVSTHIAALTLMRDMQEEFSLIYHPVSISSARSRASVTSQLLGEMQRLRWDYDRAIYLRSPGYAMDLGSLDRALATSSIKSSWAPLSSSAGNDPEILLYAQSKGLLMARGDARRLTAELLSSDSHQAGVEGKEKGEMGHNLAAYVLFDSEQLEQYASRDEESAFMGSAAPERFLREQEGICKGRGLLPGEVDKVELRRRAR